MFAAMRRASSRVSRLAAERIQQDLLITSSARASREGEMFRPRTLAIVGRLVF
jgi:hypothetical protein